VLVELLERVENFLRRLECYTEVPSTEAKMDIVEKVMVEVLSILAIATTEIKQSRISKLIARRMSQLTYLYLAQYGKKLLGGKDIEDALVRLDKVTQEEARMAIAETLKVTHNIEDKVTDGAQIVSI
jgi:histidine ammonia-lyase